MNLNPILILLGFLVVGIGWWAFGQWLRNYGYSAKLDQLGALFAKGQRHISGFVKSVLPKDHRSKK